MNYRILERIKSAVAEKGLTQRELAKGMEMSVTTINKFLNYEDELSIYMINKFSEYLEINPSWVIKGTGTRIKRKGETIEEVDDSKVWDELQKLKEQYKALGEENEKLKRITPSADSQEETAIRFLDATAVSKYPSHLNDPDFFKPLMTFKFPSSRFPKKNWLAFEVKGDEMNHTIIDGDIAFCEKIDDLASIKDSYIYMIVLENEVICRRVLNRIKSRGRLRLKCDNKYFRDKEIETEQVKEIWEIKSAHRFTLSNPYFNMEDWVKKLEDKIYECEERLDRINA